MVMMTMAMKAMLRLAMRVEDVDCVCDALMTL